MQPCTHPHMKRLFALQAKNNLVRFAPPALPHDPATCTYYPACQYRHGYEYDSTSYIPAVNVVYGHRVSGFRMVSRGNPGDGNLSPPTSRLVGNISHNALYHTQYSHDSVAWGYLR